MANAVIDGITTRYEVIGSGPPLLMYAPGGFNAVVEAWSTLASYARIKLLDHLPKRFTCILFDRRECGQSGGSSASPGSILSPRAKGCSIISASSARTLWAVAWAARRSQRLPSRIPAWCRA
jgi:pimeloyl-ACP methyl ester carboxylesterase